MSSRKIIVMLLVSLALTGCSKTDTVEQDNGDVVSSARADNHEDTFTKATTSAREQTTSSHQNIMDILESEPEEIPSSEIKEVEQSSNLIDISSYQDYTVDREKLSDIDCSGVASETTGYLTMIGREWDTLLSIFCDICHNNDIDVRELSREGTFKYAENYKYTVISLRYNTGVISVAVTSGISEVKYTIKEN